MIFWLPSLEALTETAEGLLRKRREIAELILSELRQSLAVERGRELIELAAELTEALLTEAGLAE